MQCPERNRILAAIEERHTLMQGANREARLVTQEFPDQKDRFASLVRQNELTHAEILGLRAALEIHVGVHGCMRLE